MRLSGPGVRISSARQRALHPGVRVLGGHGREAATTARRPSPGARRRSSPAAARRAVSNIGYTWTGMTMPAGQLGRVAHRALGADDPRSARVPSGSLRQGRVTSVSPGPHAGAPALAARQDGEVELAPLDLVGRRVHQHLRRVAAGGRVDGLAAAPGRGRRPAAGPGRGSATTAVARPGPSRAAGTPASPASAAADRDRLGHQVDGLERVLDAVGPLHDLADADDDRECGDRSPWRAR